MQRGGCESIRLFYATRLEMGLEMVLRQKNRGSDFSSNPLFSFGGVDGT